MSKLAYKQKIKGKIKAAALQYLREQKQKHSKVKEIEYKKLSIQNYILSPLFSNEEVNLLYALRSRGTDCKANFKNKYLHSNLLCPLCQGEIEDQQHLVKCKKLLKYSKVIN